MLTELDKKIILALRKNGRASWSSLAKQFSVSRVTIQNRVDAMRARKIIKGYTVVVDNDSPKHNLAEEKVFLHVQFERDGSVFALQKLLSTSTSVLGIWGIAGEWDCLLLLKFSNMREVADLREYICRNIKIKRLETRPVLNDFPMNDFL